MKSGRQFAVPYCEDAHEPVPTS